MSELTVNIKSLLDEINNAYRQLGIDNLQVEIKRLEQESTQPEFWNNPNNAQNIMKDISSLQARANPWLELKKSTEELVDLEALDDLSLKQELQNTYSKLLDEYQVLKKQLAFSGPYDDHDVILSIYAGAGGTDAQDWASMLLRMYVRWVESEGGQVEIIEQSVADEAGIKSATCSISGISFGYGRLKSEHGVHRLVRLSPFNSDNLRQTSFAKVDIIPKIDKPNEVKISDDDLKVDVFRSGGHGGQSVNTTDSAVRVTHLPTGITVSIQNERSQLQNKETALTILRSKLAQLQLIQHKDKLQDIKGPNQSAEWGNQIRSYVLHPYKQVKDLRTQYEASDPDKILNGDINGLINAYIEQNLGSQA